MKAERDAIVAAIQGILSNDSMHSASTPGAAPATPSAMPSEWVIPNPRGYRLGWLVASLIIGERYLDSAIDAIPVYQPDHGWDRFLLTRRISCSLLTAEASNAFGMIELAADDAPHLTDPDGNVLLPLRARFQSDIAAALDELRARLPPVGLVAGDHSACAHAGAQRYPQLYRVVAQLLADHPDVVAARELLVDDQLIDNAYHPLFIHTAERGAGLTYDWFALLSRTTGYAAFLRVNGRQSIYRTDRATWASSPQLLGDRSDEEIRNLLLSWLRLTPRPDRDHTR